MRAADDDRPRLVVMIVVDQMRADFVDRFQDDWTAGLKRFVRDGAWFQRAAYPYLETVTCAGHATVATGAFPHKHGIFQNAWYDRDRHGNIACTTDEDGSARALRYDDKTAAARGTAVATLGDSAARLMLPTFADRMREAKAARVVSLSIKDRSAIMLAGHGGDAVTWLTNTLDSWQTSSAFAKKPVEAVHDFIKEHPIEADRGKEWTRLLPAGRYEGPDDGDAEAPPRGWNRTFPHVLASEGRDTEFYSQWERSPFADAYVGAFSAALAESFALGRRETTDVLAISFSSPDLVGHAFGPDSHEVRDMFAHLDRTMGRLFDRLDALVGADRYVVALTSDHGVTPLPEQLSKRRIDAGRIDGRALSGAIERAATDVLGPGTHIARMNNTDVYFAPGHYERLAVRARDVEHVMDAIRGVGGVANVFRREELADASVPGDALRRAAALSYVPNRSGDLVIAPKPGWIFAGNGTTHGSANPDDQRVPILLVGWGIKGGRYEQPATPADIAPTLAELCGISLADAEGRVLREALLR
jgi:predicted AlkP superfamily pyrophosphatase or phosphodiesterase